jgi:phosphoribosylformylglycinamidine synthase
MVAGRDPLMAFLAERAEEGKVIIGHCNGAQVLVESGLIPLGAELRMSLARNVIRTKSGRKSPGFLNEWVWITRSCARERCATSDWEGPMHLPIAHGEGRFTTNDPDVFIELRKSDQIAFSYCDAEGRVSEDPSVTPNGSMHAIAGICNPAGNVIALMPHPERTANGDPYFASMKRWFDRPVVASSVESSHRQCSRSSRFAPLPVRRMQKACQTEIFIETIIVNNEERTLEMLAKKTLPKLSLRQFRYIAIPSRDPRPILRDISMFNPHKERAYVRTEKKLYVWNNDRKKLEPCADPGVLSGIALLRQDVPDIHAKNVGKGSETGICSVCSGVTEADLSPPHVREIFANPHASTLRFIVCREQ